MRCQQQNEDGGRECNGRLECTGPEKAALVQAVAESVEANERANHNADL